MLTKEVSTLERVQPEIHSMRRLSAVTTTVDKILKGAKPADLPVAADEV